MSEVTRVTSAAAERPHILTFVLEDYFQVGAFNAVIPRSHWKRFDSRLERNTATLLDLLADTGSRATFFCCGWVADNFPDLLGRISGLGHEVACQTYFPTPLREFGVRSLQDDLARTREAMVRAVGHLPLGFRAGRGWLGGREAWVLEQLARAGFAYDSSVGAFGPGSRLAPGATRLHRQATAAGEIWEVPVSGIEVAGMALPIAGGNYVRQLPAAISRHLIRRWVADHDAPLVAYFHAWELDPQQPSIGAAGRLQRIRHYRNIGHMRETVRDLLETYRFTSIAGYLGLQPQSACAEPQSGAIAPAVPVEPAAGRLLITVGIPCYNEEATLPYLDKTLQQFVKVFAATYDVRFVFVDDGSRDRTWERLQVLCGARSDCKLVRHAQNRGVAAAILTAIEQAETELVAILDADCTFDPLQLPRLTRMLTADVDVVTASPLHAQGEMVNVPGWRLLMSRGAAFLYRRVLHHRFASYTSCFRVYRRSRVLPMRLLNTGFGGVTEILARLDLAGARMVECPAVLESRLLGQSKINTLKTIGEHLRLLLRIALARLRHRSLPEPDDVSEGVAQPPAPGSRTSVAERDDGR